MNIKYSIKDNLTIVIPTYNEGKYVDRTITSIFKQTGIVGTRVIVADNNSNDDTRQKVNYLATLFSNKLKIEIINGGLVGTARNNGAKISNTKYILFIDGDVVLKDNDTIQRSLDEVQNNDYHLLTCKLYCHKGDWKAKLSFKLFNIVNQLISLKTPFAVGTFFLTDREIFNSHGLFDETLNHSEDYCLSKKYNPRKFKILNKFVGQDDRRFKKMGYLGMIKLLIKGFLNQNNPQFFKEDVGYWN